MLIDLISSPIMFLAKHMYAPIDKHPARRIVRVLTWEVLFTATKTLLSMILSAKLHFILAFGTLCILHESETVLFSLYVLCPKRSTVGLTGKR